MSGRARVWHAWKKDTQNVARQIKDMVYTTNRIHSRMRGKRDPHKDSKLKIKKKEKQSSSSRKKTHIITPHGNGWSFVFIQCAVMACKTQKNDSQWHAMQRSRRRAKARTGVIKKAREPHSSMKKKKYCRFFCVLFVVPTPLDSPMKAYSFTAFEHDWFEFERLAFLCIFSIHNLFSIIFLI